MTRIFHWLFMWKMDPMSGFDIRLVFTLPPSDSTLQYKRCVHFWNTFLALNPLWRRTYYTTNLIVKRGGRERVTFPPYIFYKDIVYLYRFRDLIEIFNYCIFIYFTLCLPCPIIVGRIVEGESCVENPAWN